MTSALVETTTPHVTVPVRRRGPKRLDHMGLQHLSDLLARRPDLRGLPCLTLVESIVDEATR